ncbi:MAG: hypothetical protein BWY42_00821 [Candidatus Omnitrophica bacterium ADurb.Bin277]|nr:MAG: hypothetical protein BWY42_00821 [Candidatus Omnitrophica bacterium ADurb.Bin277]
MSLIQAALNKTNTLQEKVAAPSVSAVTTPKPGAPSSARVWPGVIDEHLERELRDVQAYHRNHRVFWRKVAAGVLVLLVAVTAPVLLRSFKKVKVDMPAILSAGAVTVANVAPAQTAIPAPAPAFRLSGIINLGDRPSAVINDEIVSVGDVVSKQATVKSIGAGAVLLELGGKEIRLQL